MAAKLKLKLSSDGSESNTPESLNLEAIDQLLTLQIPGRPDVLVSLIDIFIKSSGHMLEKVQEAQSANNRVGLSKACHALRSSCSTIGATKMFHIATTIERQATSTDLDEMAELVKNLLTEFETVKTQLESLKKSRSSTLPTKKAG